MTLEDYMVNAERTQAPGFDATRINPDLMHAAMGLVTESAELLDALKKVCAYNRPLDIVNLDEEIGDIMWYLALYCNFRCAHLGNGFPDQVLERIMTTNIEKLRKRFPEKFTEQHANNRDLEAERRILEGKSE